MDSLRPLGNDDEEDENLPLEDDYLAALTSKQRRFLAEYLRDFNATQAAIRAGYSADTARQQGSRLLTNVNISAVISRVLAEQTLSTNQILFKLSLTAQSSIEPFVESYGRGLRFDFDTPEAKAALPMIKKFKQGRYGPEIELHDPIKAMVSIEQIRNKVDKDDDPAKGNGKPKVTLYMPDNARRQPPGYVPAAPLPESNPEA